MRQISLLGLPKKGNTCILYVNQLLTLELNDKTMTIKKQLELAIHAFFWAFVAAGIALICLAWGFIQMPKV